MDRTEAIDRLETVANWLDVLAAADDLCRYEARARAILTRDVLRAVAAGGSR